VDPNWLIIGASVQGTSHQKRGTPCQDAHAYRILNGGIAAVAVADGAGSATHSEQGALCVAEGLIAVMAQALLDAPPDDDVGWADLVANGFYQARQSLVALAETSGIPLRAFATTLTCALASSDRLVVGQLGDGVVVARDEEGELFAATQPQRGEYANETYFLTMDGALEQVEIQVYTQPVDAVAVMTDGLIRLAMDLGKNEPHSPFFQPLLTFASQAYDVTEAEEKLTGLLDSERVCERTDDDKTVVLVARPATVEPVIPVVEADKSGSAESQEQNGDDLDG
jgi:hypothetical protein